MNVVQQMVQTSPSKTGAEGPLVACIQACLECQQACTACADACLGEQDPKMLVRCIRLNLDCADICDVTGRVVSRQTAPEPATIRAMLQACIQICRLCGDECARHAQHGMRHCQICMDACRRCEQACNALIAG